MRFTIYKPQAIYELGKRDNQEDSIFPKIGEATDRDRLFILCDGMGGHEKGEVASNTISRALAEHLDKNASADAVVSDDVLLATLEYAYQQLDAKDDGAARKMGTTLCLLLFHRGGVTAMHIGDSRIYHIRPSEHRIVYQSKDHSLVYDLYQAGEITYDEMRTSPQKNIITRAIQPGEDNRVRPAIVHIADIKPGDYFYICSDGMLEQMENDELCDLFSAGSSDKKLRQQLIAATIDNKDNHSAYIIHINNVVMEQGDENLVDDEQTSPDNAINLNPKHIEEDVSVVSVNDNDVNEVAEVDYNSEARRKSKGYKGLVIVVAALIVCIIAGGFYFYKSKNSKASLLSDTTAISNRKNADTVKTDTNRINQPIVRQSVLQQQPQKDKASLTKTDESAKDTTKNKGKDTQKPEIEAKPAQNHHPKDSVIKSLKENLHKTLKNKGDEV